MYGKRLSVMQKGMNNTQDRSGSDFNKKKNNGHERRKCEQKIETESAEVIFEQHVSAL